MGIQRIVLSGISPQLEGQSWESESILRIGRLNTLEMYLDDPSISRRHAEILATDDGWFIHDLGSTNGTFVNGTRLGRTDRKLQPLDVVQLGLLYLTASEVVASPRPPVRSAPVRVSVEASSVRTWDAAMTEMPSLDSVSNEQAHCLLHLQSGYHLCHANSLTELLLSILEDTVTAVDADGGAIILANPDNGRLDLRRAIAISERRSQSTKPFSKTLVQRSFEQGESLLGRDAGRIDESAERCLGGDMAYMACGLLRSPRRRLGVLHVDRRADQKPFHGDVLRLIDSIAASVSTSIESAMHAERQREQFLQTVTALAQAVETRDCLTGGHTQRVTAYSLLIAEELQLPASERQLLQLGVPLHDIGKIGIEDRVLSKPGQLTDSEQAHMRTHVIKGVAILETISTLSSIIPIVRHHHERWDGTGYPDGLKGEEIPLLARITGVADAFDAMTADRPYRRAMSMESAMEVLRKGACSQFDPDCVAAIVRLGPRLGPLLSEEATLKRLSEASPGTSPNRVPLRIP